MGLHEAYWPDLLEGMSPSSPRARRWLPEVYSLQEQNKDCHSAGRLATRSHMERLSLDLAHAPVLLVLMDQTGIPHELAKVRARNDGVARDTQNPESRRQAPGPICTAQTAANQG